MKIGIGITTYQRPRHLEYCLKQIQKHSPSDVMIHVEDDTDHRKGVFYRKNQCLRKLWDAGCDYFVLLDDDCFPIADGWLDLYIKTYQSSNQQVLIYNSRPQATLEIRNGVNIVFEVTGPLIFLTRKAVETIGGFNMAYLIYGFGHRTYVIRAFTAGLNTYGRYLSPEHAEKYMYAMDLDTHLPINRYLNHKSTMDGSFKLKLLSRNRKIMMFDNEIHQPF